MEREAMRRLLGADLPDTARRVLLCLALHSDEDGLAYPSVSTIAAELNVHASTVQRALRRLEGHGHVSTIGSPAGGRGRTTRYLVREKGRTHDATLSSEKKDSGQGATLSGEEAGEKGSTPDRKGSHRDPERVANQHKKGRTLDATRSVVSEHPLSEQKEANDDGAREAFASQNGSNESIPDAHHRRLATDLGKDAGTEYAAMRAWATRNGEDIASPGGMLKRWIETGPWSDQRAKTDGQSFSGYTDFESDRPYPGRNPRRLLPFGGIDRPEPTKLKDCSTDEEVNELLQSRLAYVREQDPGFTGGWPPPTLVDVPNWYRDQWNRVLVEAGLDPVGPDETEPRPIPLSLPTTNDSEERDADRHLVAAVQHITKADIEAWLDHDPERAAPLRAAAEAEIASLPADFPGREAIVRAALHNMIRKELRGKAA